VAEHSVTRERVSAHLRESLAAYKHPRRILFLPELPRNPRGKLDHEALLREARK
jgi:acyl-CoA synthetase (AMP-forming)/AMP-acid ligase II